MAFRAADQTIGEDSYERLVRERGSAFHEGGHAIAAAAAEGEIFAVAIGERPVLMSAYPQDASPLVRLIGFAAGHHCEGLASAFGPPTLEVLADYIELARAGATGSCDSCKSAKLLCKSFAGLDDDALVRAWRSAFELTAALFKTPAWRSGLFAVAGALRDRIRLTGEDIAALVDADALRAAQAAVLADVDVADPATWTRKGTDK